MGTALLAAGSSDSGPAGITVLRCQWRLWLRQWMAVESGGRESSWARLCSPPTVSTVDRLMPRLWVWVEAAVASVHGSREWWNRRSSWARSCPLPAVSTSRRSSWAWLCLPMAVSTVDRLPPMCADVGGGGGSGVSGWQSRVVESAEQLGTALLADGSVDSEPAASACRWRRRWCQWTAVESGGVGGAVGHGSARRWQFRQWTSWHHRASVSVEAVVASVDGSREWWPRKQLGTALLAADSVDSGPADATFVGLGGGGGGVSARQSRVVEPAEQLGTELPSAGSVDKSAEQLGMALLADGSVDSGPAAASVCGCRWRRRWYQWTAVKSGGVSGAIGHCSAGRWQCQQ